MVARNAASAASLRHRLIFPRRRRSALRRAAPGLSGAAFASFFALAGAAAVDIYVRPLARGAFDKFDTATVRLDLPAGLSIRPGSAEFRMVSRDTGRTRNAQVFPLWPVGPPSRLRTAARG